MKESSIEATPETITVTRMLTLPTMTVLKERVETKLQRARARHKEFLSAAEKDLAHATQWKNAAGLAAELDTYERLWGAFTRKDSKATPEALYDHYHARLVLLAAHCTNYSTNIMANELERAELSVIGNMFDPLNGLFS